MPSLKDLRNRIASVKATQKITKAMQMVAAAKLRRAQTAAEAARPYAQRMGAVLTNVAGGIAPFSMQTYEETAPWSAVMADACEARTMPPWHAVETDECTPPHAFEHDARLDEEQIERFAAWAELGAPEGDPALAAPLPQPMALELSDPSVVMTMAASLFSPVM